MSSSRLQQLRLILQLSCRNLVRQRRRSVVAVCSVAFGVVSIVLASGFMEWMFVDFREAMIESEFAHIQIARQGYHEEGHADPAHYVIKNSERIIAATSKLDARAVTPRLGLSGLIGKGESTVAFVGEGIDPAKDMTDDRALKVLRGGRLRSTEADEILIGQGLAGMLGAEVGDRLVLMVNTERGGISARECEVAGIVSSVSKAFDDSAVLMHVRTARALLKVDGAHRWMVYLNDTADTDRTAAALREALHSSAFEVKAWSDLAEFYKRAVDLLRDQIGVVRFVVIVIIILGIGNTMMMSALERAGEFGTALALGYSRNGLLSQLLCEGAVIGFVGGMLGLLLSWILAVGITMMGIEMPPPPGLSRGYVARVLITSPMLAEAMLLALVTTVLACVYPALKVTRMPIVDALRQNR